MPEPHRSRPARLLAGALLLAAATAGCGTSPQAAPAATGHLSSYDQDFVDYARCMRAHGVSNFPDPVHVPGHAGLTLQMPDGLDIRSGVGKAAHDACQRYLQPVLDMKARGGGAPTADRLQALADYSRCMRTHRIPLLDPDPADGHISLGPVAGLPEPPGGRSDPLFAAADAACRHLLPPDTPDDGTGPA